MLRSQHLLPCNFPFAFSHSTSLSTFHASPFSSSNPVNRPSNYNSIRARLRSRLEPWLAQLSEATTATTPSEDGPVELPPSASSIFATTDDPSPLQVATSVLLTGAISVFLFRSLRRRAKRAKELRFRSTGAKSEKSLKEEALDSLKAMTPTSVEASSPPSAAQALLGALSAGVIALILYKFTTTVEASLNRQNISDNFSARQITITIRTIINGLCYLATFIFGINSVGLFLYSGQLAIKSFMEGDMNKTNSVKAEEQLETSSSTTKDPILGKESGSSDGAQSSDDAQ